MSKILTTDSWDCMLPGPPSRNNFGSADLSPSGLLAFAAGSSISVVDAVSLQLIATLPLTPSSSTSPTISPFVTAVRWTPQPLRRDLLATEPSSSHLILAAGDRHGRISLIDFRLGSIVLTFEPPDPLAKSGVQDLCWAQSRHDSFVLASISGPSLFSIYNAVSSRCIFKYDASPELLSCVRRDPFDSRHICVIGLKGFFLSVKVLGDSEEEIVIKEFQIRTDCTELSRLERDAASGGGLSSSPASGVYPQYHVKFAFSPIWKHVIYVTFPRELVVFDLQYQTRLFSASLPRGIGKFLGVLPDPNYEVLYCVHVDGKISIWRRKEGEQVHILCMREELIPSIATTVPSPSVLAVLICQPESTLQNVSKLYSGSADCHSPQVDFDNPFDFYDDSFLVTKTRLVSISDDGKIWSWLLTAEGVGDSEKETTNTVVMADARELLPKNTSANTLDSSNSKPAVGGSRQVEHTHGGKIQLSNSGFNLADITFKISLVQQLQLLSSTVTMLAVPSPSLTATLARGGNHPAVAVPLVALGTQGGTVDVVDVSANAIAASFLVHSSTVRGLRWLGNSRLVSFSYTQASEKTGGYINRLVVTCVRSGLNRPFRVLQKPERAPVRALRASSSGRYLLILFRDAPVEVWAMTKNPIMLRSLALPFTVLEWTLPTVPRPNTSDLSRQLSSSSSSKDTNVAGASDEVTSTAPSSDSKTVSSDNSQEDISESFAFALVNGALGVFEVHGRRIRDFRPKWPSTSFVSSDGLITAMAYRLPHVVMGDRSGNIRWWDVTTGQSSSFNTHRDGIRRIKFSPFVPGDRSRGRIAVLFYDNTFSVFDLDSPDPLANSLLQPQFPGTLVLELDWLPLRTDKNDPLVLSIAGADSSFRLVEVNINDKKAGVVPAHRPIKERFRPMPVCCPVLLPVPHALALRMILQLGVKPSWFNTCGTAVNKRLQLVSGTAQPSGDLRSYMIELPPVVDSVVPELLLKVLEPYRKEGCILDDERARLYATIVNKGAAARFAFAAAIFGETAEALFWLRLPHAIGHLMNKLVNKSPKKIRLSATNPELDDTSMLSRINSKGKSTAETGKDLSPGGGQLRLMAFEQEELWENANQRISWHEKLEGEEALQNHVHELVTVGNLEAAVSLLLTTSPDSSYFYPNALRAVALSSAVSKSLHELAVKVVAANMVRTDRSLSGIHLLCAVGRHQEACSQLQDAGFWTDAATLAATHLKGSDYARGGQVMSFIRNTTYGGKSLVFYDSSSLQALGNPCALQFQIPKKGQYRALLLYVAAGAMQEALAALREAQLADTAAMFIVACREIHAEIMAKLEGSDDESGSSFKNVALPGLDPEKVDVIAVGEYFGQYQKKLVHLCVDAQPFSD